MKLVAENLSSMLKKQKKHLKANESSTVVTAQNLMSCRSNTSGPMRSTATWKPTTGCLKKFRCMTTSNNGMMTRILNDRERNIIRVGIGYFCSAEGIVGDCAQTIIRENLSAPELKMAVGRHVQEENIHTESLLYMISSLAHQPTRSVSALFVDAIGYQAKIK